MKLKEKERSNLFLSLKKNLKVFSKYLFNKKVALLLGIFLLIIIFMGGILSGLLFSKFFGSIDNPSQKTIQLMHALGFKALKDIRTRFEGIKKENIRIPINYFKGKFSNPKQLYIDTDFKDYKTLEYKRQQALELGFLHSSEEDFVPAIIRLEDKELNAKIRLKGDLPDHFEGDKWSFRIKIKGDNTLFGLESFSIQDPGTRNYLNEWVYHQILKKEKILHLKYEFIEVIFNGDNKGIYALEEHFDKQLMTSNKLREGVIIKFNENEVWEEILDQGVQSELDYFYTAEILSFQNKTVSENPILSDQFKTARNLLDGFRKKLFTTEEVFNVEKLAKSLAINTLIGSSHGSRWHNVRFYYNPLTSKLEPIGWDQYAGGNSWDILNEYISQEDDLIFWWDLLFEEETFKQKYFQELERLSNESYLDELFLELKSEIEENTNILRKDDFLYYFSKEPYYRNQKQIKERLKYFQELSNEDTKSIKLDNFILSNTNLSELNFLEIDFQTNNIFIKKGTWQIKENLIIPKGFILNIRENTILDLVNNSTILSYSKLNFIGTKDNPIKIISSDKSGEGISVIGASENSKLEFVEIIGQANPSKSGFNPTGAITFYKSPFTFSNVLIENSRSEDALNGILSNYQVEDSIFRNCFSDCFDDDFGEGDIKNSEFINCGNDCIDFSGTLTSLEKLKIINPGDKGISLGEESNVTINNVVINNNLDIKNKIGIAVKDSSHLDLKNAEISNCIYGFAIYQKKSEFGPAFATAEEVNFFNVTNSYIIEKNSEFLLNGRIILGGNKKVYEKLYTV
jgi:hypothetical protein